MKHGLIKSYAFSEKNDLYGIVFAHTYKNCHCHDLLLPSKDFTEILF